MRSTPIARQGDETHPTTAAARAGSENLFVRHVLLIGLTLAIVALSAIWITGALTAPQGDHNGVISTQATPQL